MHIAGMAKNVTIRGVPDEVRDELARRARLHGQSLQEFLLGQLIELAARMDPSEWVSAVEAQVSDQAQHPTSDEIVRWIREARDGRP